MSSNVNSPALEPQVFAAPSTPSPLAQDNGLPLDDDIPALSLDVLTKQEDKVDALKLVADSIAQQRQQASFNIVFHPASLAVLFALFAMIYKYAWVMRNKDSGLALVLCSSAVMTYLLAIRWLASPYIRLAESLRWDWLENEDGDEDTIIGTRFGGDLIGALVLRLEPNASLAGKKKNRNLSLKGGKGVIRAWTTKLRYRRKGVGSDMLHEAVRLTRERCGRDAEVGFALEHANSNKVLPEMFNGPFRKQEIKAAKALESVLAEWDGNKRKR